MTLNSLQAQGTITTHLQISNRFHQPGVHIGSRGSETPNTLKHRTTHPGLVIGDGSKSHVEAVCDNHGLQHVFLLYLLTRLLLGRHVVANAEF